MTTMALETPLAAREVSVRFGGLTAVDDVTFEVGHRQLTALIGPNGAGKTTLINVLSGLAAPTSGHVEWQGVPQRRWTLSTACRSGVTRTFQATRVFGELTVAENLRIGGLCHSGARSGEEILSLLSLTGREEADAGSLSFGELRRLGVALALATDPTVLLLDEPGAGLNGPDLDALAASLRAIQEAGMTVVLIDHNMRFVMRTAERVVVLDGGRVIADGSPADVQTDDLVRSSYLGRGHDA